MKHVSIVRRTAAVLLAAAAVIGGASVAIAQPMPASTSSTATSAADTTAAITESADEAGTDAAPQATKFKMVRSTGAVNAGHGEREHAEGQVEDHEHADEGDVHDESTPR